MNCRTTFDRCRLTPYNGTVRRRRRVRGGDASRIIRIPAIAGMKGVRTPIAMKFFLPAAVLFVLLHLAASVLFPGSFWGAHHLRYAPPWAHAVWVVSLIAIFLPKTRDLLAVAASRADTGLDRSGKAGTLLLAAGSFLLFLLFRTRSLFLGDGFLITSVVQSREETGVGAAGFASLTIHRSILNALRFFDADANAAIPFVLTSCLAGAAAVLLARAISRQLCDDRAAAAALFAAITGSGAMLLFFGYVEHYTLMQAALLLYLFLALRCLKGEGGLAPPTLALAMTVALHISSLALAPSWLLLLFRRGITRGKAVALLLLSAAIGAAGFLFLLRYTERYYSGFEALLPWIDKGDHSYTFLSGHHYAFLGNELFLLLGAALLLPLLRTAPLESETGSEEDAELHAASSRSIDRFLAGTAFLGLVYLFFLDPFLGSRDWDLMALPAFPAILLLGRLSFRRGRSPSRSGAVLVAGLAFLHLFPFVASQTDRDRAVAMTVAMTAGDPHYANPAARAPKSFGVLLSRGGYPEEAALFFEKAAGLTEDAQNLFNLGTSRGKGGEYAEAARLLRRAIELEPYYEEAYINLAWALKNLEQSERAEAVLGELLRIAPRSADAWRSLGILLADGGRHEEATDALREATRCDPDDGEAWTRLGLLLARAGDEEEARETLHRALEIDPRNKRALSVLRAIEPGL